MAHYDKTTPLRTYRMPDTARLRCSQFLPNCTHVHNPVTLENNT